MGKGFIKACYWDQQVQRKGGKQDWAQGETKQDAVSAESSADPTDSFEGQMTLQSCLQMGDEAFCPPVDQLSAAPTVPGLWWFMTNMD